MRTKSKNQRKTSARAFDKNEEKNAERQFKAAARAHVRTRERKRARATASDAKRKRRAIGDRLAARSHCACCCCRCRRLIAVTAATTAATIAAAATRCDASLLIEASALVFVVAILYSSIQRTRSANCRSMRTLIDELAPTKTRITAVDWLTACCQLLL